jgi:hypothetical protein
MVVVVVNAVIQAFFVAVVSLFLLNSSQWIVPYETLINVMSDFLGKAKIPWLD